MLYLRLRKKTNKEHGEGHMMPVLKVSWKRAGPRCFLVSATPGLWFFPQNKMVFCKCHSSMINKSSVDMWCCSHCLPVLTSMCTQEGIGRWQLISLRGIMQDHWCLLNSTICILNQDWIWLQLTKLSYFKGPPDWYVQSSSSFQFNYKIILCKLWTG